MTVRNLASLTVIVSMWCATESRGMLIRPDREDAQYLALAEKFPASCLMNLPDGEGTLIAPAWVLTAAHIGVEIEKVSPKPNLEFAGKSYEIERVLIHPNWEKGGPHDLALVKLKQPVEGVQPIPIYRGKNEKGMVATIVGHGYPGTLDKGPVGREKWDKKKRAGTNRFEKNTSHRLGFVVDQPETATDLEATSGPGDSGCGAFVEVEGVTYVAAVMAGTDDVNNNGIIGDYGDVDIGARLSAYVDWIDSVTKGTPSP